MEIPELRKGASVGIFEFSYQCRENGAIIAVLRGRIMVRCGLFSHVSCGAIPDVLGTFDSVISIVTSAGFLLRLLSVLPRVSRYKHMRTAFSAP